MFALNADNLAVRDMAKSFADERLAPHSLEWDETEHFPADVLREAAALGMAAIYVGEQHGGSAMTRLDAALIFAFVAELADYGFEDFAIGAKRALFRALFEISVEFEDGGIVDGFSVSVKDGMESGEDSGFPVDERAVAVEG